MFSNSSIQWVDKFYWMTAYTKNWHTSAELTHWLEHMKSQKISEKSRDDAKVCDKGNLYH